MRPSRFCRRLLFVSVLFSVSATAANAGPTPGSNTNYTWPADTVLSAVDFVVTVKTDPGTAGNVFWSSQFNFSDGSTAYTGMQSDGGSPRQFLFSVWDAKEAKAGSRGSFCVPFAENGTGRSCRMRRAWTQGHPYRFHLAHEGNNWFGVTVTDLTTGAGFKLGSVRTRSATIDPANMSNWTEYFEWNFDTATCVDQPFSSAEFALPVANATVTAHIGSTEPSKTCSEFTRIETSATGSVHINGLGNSLRMPVKSEDGLCLDARGGSNPGTPAITFHCTGRENQAWVLGSNGELALSANLCVGTKGQAKPGSLAIVMKCSNAVSQQWTYRGSNLQAAGQALCLTSHGSDVQLTTETCGAKSAQAWAIRMPN